jgi:hypothetical protein
MTKRSYVLHMCVESTLDMRIFEIKTNNLQCVRTHDQAVAVYLKGKDQWEAPGEKVRPGTTWRMLA